MLGSGASSDVYLCKNLKIGNKAVVKIIEITNRNSGGFHAEIEVLSKIHHPNMPYIIDTYEDEQYLYIFETFVEGKTLADKLGECYVLKEESVYHFFEQILDIIKYLHDLKPPILYKDMKPSNIIVNDEDKLFLIDFGISRIIQDSCQREEYMAGTPNYASPEQFKPGYMLDERTDIYSIGTLFYKIITGDIFTGKFDKLEQSPNISTTFKEILKKCLRSNIDERYKNIEEVMLAFKEVRNKTTSTAVGKKIIIVNGPMASGKSTIISGLSNVYSNNRIKTAIIDMTKNQGAALFWDVEQTQYMKYMIDSDDYEAIKNSAIRPNNRLFIYKMIDIEEADVISFINKVIKFVDIVLVEANEDCSQKLYEQGHDILLITKQEQKYIYETMNMIDKYIGNNVYMDNLTIVINEYIDIREEETRLLSIYNKKLKENNKTVQKKLSKIPNIARKSYIDNLQKGLPIYTNEEKVEEAFTALGANLFESKKDRSLIKLIRERIERWLIQEKVKS